MSLLQAGYRTYESYAHMAGAVEEGKEPLCPVSHAIINAEIEICLNADGSFSSASPVVKEEAKTIIPVTLLSANRTSKECAHPLCDQLRYLAAFGGKKYDMYLAGLQEWASSDFSHPKVEAILHYILGKTIVSDLAGADVIKIDEQGLPIDKKQESSLIRWRVTPTNPDIRSACWEDTSLFNAYTAFYASQCASMEQDVCLISGKKDIVCSMHPKGVVAATHNAKLVSSNDSSGFTYRGRFKKPEHAYNIGYTASQKAHHALRWISANHRVFFGQRVFLCWSPNKAALPMESLFGFSPEQQAADFVSYRQLLSETLSGYKNALSDTDDVVIAALEPATTGRLSVTYYSQLSASDFLRRIEHWYRSFCWDTRFGVQSPPLKRVIDCTFGTQRKEWIEADTSILSEQVQRLVRCMIDSQPLPFDMVQALYQRASTPLAYTEKSRETLLVTACAVIRKYHNDKLCKEEWTLALDTTNRDRSYLFGRLLAVLEQAERATYDPGTKREPNAIRMQAVYSQRPMFALRIIEESLIPYFARLSPGLRSYYKKLIGEIMDMLPNENPIELKKKLGDTYLLGYYHQRSALFRKKDTTTEEENEYESANE